MTAPTLAIDWHPVLRHLVREHLLPELRKHHNIEIYDIETIHNPVRARTVDGQVIDDYADNDHIQLTPADVTIPYDVVTRAVRTLGLPRDAPADQGA